MNHSMEGKPVVPMKKTTMPILFSSLLAIMSPGMGKGGPTLWFKKMVISYLWVMKFRHF